MRPSIQSVRLSIPILAGEGSFLLGPSHHKEVGAVFLLNTSHWKEGITLHVLGEELGWAWGGLMSVIGIAVGLGDYVPVPVHHGIETSPPLTDGQTWLKTLPHLLLCTSSVGKSLPARKIFRIVVLLIHLYKKIINRCICDFHQSGIGGSTLGFAILLCVGETLRLWWSSHPVAHSSGRCNPSSSFWTIVRIWTSTFEPNNLKEL